MTFIVPGPSTAKALQPLFNFKEEESRPSIKELSTGIKVTGISYKRASEVEAKPIRWLWKNRIARGKVSMLAGNPGLGKSQITASLAAIVTTGGNWPVDRTKCEPGNVVIFSAEDDPADTIRPRLEVAGANLDKVFIIDPAPVLEFLEDGRQKRRAFNLEDDLPRLEKLLDEINDVALVVIDPVTAYLGKADGNQNAEIRALLSPLSDLAAKHGAAIVCVSHFNKTAGNDALMRIMGSLAFVAAARAAYAVLVDPDDKSRRLFLPIKNNNGDDQSGLAFKVQGATIQAGPNGLIETSQVVWESEIVHKTASEVLAAGDNGDKTATDEAIEWLGGLLADGPMKAGEVQKEARQAGIGEKPLRSARERLCKKPYTRGIGLGWWWELRETTTLQDAQGDQDAQLAHIQKQGILGGGGHLGEAEPHQLHPTEPNPPPPSGFMGPVNLDDLVGPTKAERKKARGRAWEGKL